MRTVLQARPTVLSLTAQGPSDVTRRLPLHLVPYAAPGGRAFDRRSAPIRRLG